MPTQPLTIGTSEPRKDLRPKVTGSTRYTSDIAGPDAWTGIVLRSPHHHARLLGIDLARARALTGVKAVLTGADIPGSQTYGALVSDQPVLAVDVVRHLGEPVALIVAATPEAARQAADLISVRYEVLPAVFDPIAALEPGAPQVHPDGNLLSRFCLETGDLEAGFAASEVILAETFDVPRVAPAYLEAETAAAAYQPDGSVTVWVSSQQPFEDRRHIAAVLGIPAGCVQVKSAAVGGAFGGKEDSEIAILAALGAWTARGAVRIANTRSESFLAHPKRHPAHLAYRVGARRDGTLVALEAQATLDTGAYASLGPAVASLLTELLCGAYRVPHARMETRLAYTNSPPSGAVRGFGSPQAHFAVESLMDMLAGRLGIDPLEIRRRNVLRPGDRLVSGVPVNDTALSLPQILEAVEDARRGLEQIPPAEGKTAGTGFALAMQSMGLGAKVPDDSTQRLAWMPDGSVRVFLGAPDVGQGLAAAAEQITAEALGIPYARVHAVEVDTRVSPDGGITCASRMTYLVGNSLLLAAEQLKQALLAASAPLFGAPVEQLAYDAGAVVLRREAGEVRVPVAELTGRLAENGVPLEAQATFSFPYPPETTPMGLPAGMPHVLFGFGGQVIRVEVDPQTGQTEATHVVAIHDAGRVINRPGVEGQIHGGTLMAIGYALLENMPLKPDGRWVDGFAEYLLPTSADLPGSFQTIILEIPEASGPYGAKGVGEITAALAAPAIANAVYRACGCRVRSLPIHPQAVAQIYDKLT